MIPIRYFFQFIILCVVNIGLFNSAFAQESANTEISSTAQTNIGHNQQEKIDAIEDTHSFYREKTVTTPDGKSQTKREYVTQTIPGEELIAIATYTYKKTKPSKEVVFILKIPKQVSYVANSVTDSQIAWFSTDNAKEWSKFADLRFVEPDGSKRIAEGKDVTHIQWRINKPFKYGDTGTLEYKVVVR